jgi:ATP-binding cassette subfamily B protein
VPDWGLLVRLVLLELALALLSDVLSRLSSLLESLLGDLFSNEMSVRLMRHAATLDLQHFEDPDFFDKMQRARRQTMGRVALMSQVLGMGQQAVTLLSLLAALVAFNGWLLVILVLAILPSFLGETAYAGIAYSFISSGRSSAGSSTTTAGSRPTWSPPRRSSSSVSRTTSSASTRTSPTTT